MLKTAAATVLRKNRLLIACLVATGAAAQYWRDRQVSVLALVLIVVAILGALAVTALPVELHRLRRARPKCGKAGLR